MSDELPNNRPYTILFNTQESHLQSAVVYAASIATDSDTSTIELYNVNGDLIAVFPIDKVVGVLLGDVGATKS